MKKIVCRGIIALIVTLNVQASDSLGTQALVRSYGKVALEKAAIPVALLAVAVVGARYAYTSCYIPYKNAFKAVEQVESLKRERDSLIVQRDALAQKEQKAHDEIIKSRLHIDFHKKIAHQAQEAKQEIAGEKKELADRHNALLEEIRTTQQRAQEKAEARARRLKVKGSQKHKRTFSR